MIDKGWDLAIGVELHIAFGFVVLVQEVDEDVPEECASATMDVLLQDKNILMTQAELLENVRNFPEVDALLVAAVNRRVSSSVMRS